MFIAGKRRHPSISLKCFVIKLQYLLFKSHLQQVIYISMCIQFNQVNTYCCVSSFLHQRKNFLPNLRDTAYSS
ncbi:hypothetical protein FGO68_gene15975 [Halteria grandinella]|uniref:Uncharacterized protein n=1 Tax=Halteria grandinella TaxID=5974 RepID=A0A8J8SWX4_HALGN|nr:hypothetical protein FGO68_gene15975 [Halteria grandinella]